MARFARVVGVNQPHHVTHRGNRRGEVFFAPEDRRAYLADLAEYCRRFDLEIWGYCLMTNHVHLLAVPRREDSLALAIGRAHMRHARRINRSRRWSGHLWANRFYSTILDGAHLWAAIKYIELNPVRAGLAVRAEDYGDAAGAWSSARAHAAGAADPLLAPGRPFAGGARCPLTGAPLPWAEWLRSGLEDQWIRALRRNTMTGRPCGEESFARRLEADLGRALMPSKRGRKAN